nr:MAG TPA: hypothetical protein [Caudoviricetes sp.]
MRSRGVLSRRTGYALTRLNAARSWPSRTRTVPGNAKGPPPFRVGVRVCVAYASRVPGSGPRPGRWPRGARREPV